MPSKILDFEYQRFGSEFKAARKRLGLSVRQVNDQTGICYQRVWEIERGAHVNSYALILLAFWADLTISDFVVVNLKPENRQ